MVRSRSGDLPLPHDRHLRPSQHGARRLGFFLSGAVARLSQRPDERKQKTLAGLFPGSQAVCRRRWHAPAFPAVIGSGTMIESTDILVLGGGPGGLACATLLARQGAKVALAERKSSIGPKVCAGGITWHGLLRHVPDHLVERAFPEQHIVTPRQRFSLVEPNPIIATVNRQRLGQWMAGQAEGAGVRLLTGTRAVSQADGRATLETANGRRITIDWGHLVGADGSNSLVRRFLGLPTTAMGVGVHCMHPGHYPRMEWHLDGRKFGSGYGWLFPHAESCSVGAYGDARQLSARLLKDRLLLWADGLGIRLDPAALRAGLINYDFRGLRFGRTWLVGDAAGLASGLTGEGIYPALVSGETVARMILDPHYRDQRFDVLVRKQRQHRRMVALAGSNSRLTGLLIELSALMLRLKVVALHSLEMAK